MGDELLINFNDSMKVESADGPKVGRGSDAGKEIKRLPNLSSLFGSATNLDSKVKSNSQEKCILDKDYDELIPQLSSPIKANLDSSNIESSDLIGLSPVGCLKVSRPNTRESDLIDKSNPTNLLSPFGYQMRIRSRSASPDLNLKLMVPTGDLLPVQDESKSSIPADVFDVEVLEKKCGTKYNSVSSDSDQDLNKLSLILSSIPSIGSGESQYSSCGVINNGFLEAKSPVEQVDLSKSPNDSVFEEAKALAENFARMAKCEADVAVEGIESETSSIVSDCLDLDDIDLKDMLLTGNELDELLDIYTVGSDSIFEEEMFSKFRINANKMESKNVSEMSPRDRTQTASSSSNLSISPLPLSTERLSQMKLKANESVGAPLKLASLKKNTLTCPTAVAGRSGPLKALVPLSQMVKNSVSPVGIVHAKPRSVKLSEASPEFLRPARTSTAITSSTPKLNKLHNSTKLIPSIKKGLNGNIKGANNPKSNHESSGPRSSNTVRTNEAGKHSSIARPVTTALTRKASIPSPSVGGRYSNSTPNVRTPVMRSSSTGHLPLTPSMKKLNGATNSQSFQSPLRRSNSLSSKLSAGSPSRTLKTSSVNSPVKAGTPLDKLISKFRRVSVSRGMKENVSPGKY